MSGGHLLHTLEFDGTCFGVEEPDGKCLGSLRERDTAGIDLDGPLLPHAIPLVGVPLADAVVVGRGHERVEYGLARAVIHAQLTAIECTFDHIAVIGAQFRDGRLQARLAVRVATDGMERKLAVERSRRDGRDEATAVNNGVDSPGVEGFGHRLDQCQSVVMVSTARPKRIRVIRPGGQNGAGVYSQSSVFFT